MEGIVFLVYGDIQLYKKAIEIIGFEGIRLKLRHKRADISGGDGSYPKYFCVVHGQNAQIGFKILKAANKQLPVGAKFRRIALRPLFPFSIVYAFKVMLNKFTLAVRCGECFA